jgi:hypothetical protein
MHRSKGFHDYYVLRLMTGAIGSVAGAYAYSKIDTAKLRLNAARNIFARVKVSERDSARLARPALLCTSSQRLGDEVIAANVAQWPCAHRSSA